MDDVQIQIEPQPGLFTLYFQGEILEDEKVLSEYGIRDHSVINIISGLRGGMQIIVKVLDGKSVAFKVNETDKISDVKKKIYEKTGLSPKRQNLVYQDIPLDNGETVGNYQLSEGSVVNMVAVLRPAMQIFVKTLDGKTATCEFLRTDKISDLKKKIHKKIGLASDEQKLIYHGKILLDEGMVDDYLIGDKSVINVIARLRPVMQINARTLDGKTVAFEVKKTEKIINMKKKIQLSIGLAPDEQCLIYQGEILEDERTAGDYLFDGNSVIRIVARERCSMRIYAKRFEGEIVAIYVQKEDKISTIKWKIQTIIGLAEIQQKLYYQGEILSDERTVGDYQIREGSVVNIANH